VLDKIAIRLESNSGSLPNPTPKKRKGAPLVQHSQKQSKPTEKSYPLYQADEGPLSQRQLGEIKKGAPKLIAAVVRSRLFGVKQELWPRPL
jgi:hypothetical protein